MIESLLAEHIAAVACFSPMGDSGLSMWEQAQASVPFYPPENDRKLLALAARAGTGDVSAQRELATFSLYTALQGGDETDRLAYVIEGLMVARMAAAHGHVDDQFLCASMLSLAALLSGNESAQMFAAEALARMELLADEPGDIGEQAARIVTMCADGEAPETLELAKRFRDDLVAAKGVI